MFNDKLIRNNAFLVLGSVGTIIILLLMLSFEWFWYENLLEVETNLTNHIEFYIAIFISLSAAALLALQIKKRSWKSTQLIGLHFCAVHPHIHHRNVQLIRPCHPD
jgi:Ca2+/Na+ antiporter